MSTEDYEIRCRLTPVDRIEEEEEGDDDDDDFFPSNVLCLEVVAKFMRYRSRLALQEQEDGDHDDDDELQLYDPHCHTLVSKLLLRCEELVSEEESSRSAIRFCHMVLEITVRPLLIERTPDGALQMVQDERYLARKFLNLKVYIDIPPRDVYNYGSNIDLPPMDVYNYGRYIDLQPRDVHNYGSEIDLPPRDVYNYGSRIDLPRRDDSNDGSDIDLPPRDVYNYSSRIDLLPRDDSNDGSDIDLPPRDVYNYSSRIDLPPRDVSNDGNDEDGDEDNDDEELNLVPASKSSIEALERVRAEGSACHCTICLEEISNGSEATRMPCYHLFHGQCICDWLEISRVCPLCRFEIL